MLTLKSTPTCQYSDCFEHVNHTNADSCDIRMISFYDRDSCVKLIGFYLAIILMIRIFEIFNVRCIRSTYEALRTKFARTLKNSCLGALFGSTLSVSRFFLRWDMDKPFVLDCRSWRRTVWIFKGKFCEKVSNFFFCDLCFIGWTLFWAQKSRFWEPLNSQKINK